MVVQASTRPHVPPRVPSLCKANTAFAGVSPISCIGSESSGEFSHSDHNNLRKSTRNLGATGDDGISKDGTYG